MFTNEHVLGVVMCGGQSQRMGSDKGLLLKSGKTWAEIAVEKLQVLGLHSVISINPNQKETYSKHFSSNQLILDNVDLLGPVGGLLSVHSLFPENDLMILACDLIDIKSQSLEYIYKQVIPQGSEFDFTVYQNKEKEAEPLVGIYSSEGLSKIYKFYISNLLEKKSMKYILDISNTQYLDFPFPEEELRNYNSLEV